MTAVRTPFLMSLGAASLLVVALLALMMSLLQKGEAVLNPQAAPRTRIIMRPSLAEKGIEARIRQLPPTPKAAPNPATAETFAPDQQVSDQPVFAIRPDLLAKGTGGPALYANFADAAKYGVGSVLGLAPDQNRGMTPLVRVAPLYPLAARMKKITGFVLLEFDVTADGTTANAQVVNAEPPGYFDQAALDAIAKWRYRPRLQDGKPVPVSDLYVQLTFDLQQLQDPRAARREAR